MIKGLLILILILSINAASLKDILRSKVIAHKERQLAKVPAYPSLLPLIGPLNDTLVNEADKGLEAYKLVFKIDRTWRTAPAKLNNAIDEWNKQNITEFAVKRFDDAIKEFRDHWNRLNPSVQMSSGYGNREFWFKWSKSQYDGIIVSHDIVLNY